MKIEAVTKRGWFRLRWWWRIVGANGEIVASSELYSSRAARDDTIAAVQRAMHVGLPVVEVTK